MKKIFRIIDANLNRAREGLRVCEDISRFTMPKKPLAGLLKNARHSATRAVLSSGNLALKKLVRSRDVKKDLMKFNDMRRSKNSGLSGVFMANIERAKESLRVIEECAKVIDEGVSRRYRKIRFKIYEIEKKYNDSAGIR